MERRLWAYFLSARRTATKPRPRATTTRSLFIRSRKRDGLFAASINGDAFSDEIKRAAAETIRSEMAPVDLVIYSLASPKRTDPRTGNVHNSVLKPVGQPYTNRTIELDSEKVVSVTLQPANEEEIADTVAVMGGEDWRLWMEMLLEEKLLAPGARTLAYSYIGPEITWPIYRDGTIGQAKKDLERAAKDLDADAREQLGGNAWVSVNKAVVTQASAAIPVVPLYLSLLSMVMKKKNLEEGPLEQMRRLFTDFLCTGKRRSSMKRGACAWTIAKCGRRAGGSRGAVAAGHHGKSSRGQRFRRISARVSRPVWI